MPKRRSKPTPRKARKEPLSKRPYSTETRAADALTIAWTVSVTAVLICELIAVAAHLYVRAFPPADMMQMLEVLAIFSAGTIGVVSLVLLGVILRIRRVRPPQGLIAFAVVVTAAPLVAIVVRMLM